MKGNCPRQADSFQFNGSFTVEIGKQHNQRIWIEIDIRIEKYGSEAENPITAEELTDQSRIDQLGCTVSVPIQVCVITEIHHTPTHWEQCNTKWQPSVFHFDQNYWSLDSVHIMGYTYILVKIS